VGMDRSQARVAAAGTLVPQYTVRSVSEMRISRDVRRPLTRLPLHRRNSPILEASEEGDESSHGAGSVAGASAAEEQAALEVRPRGGVCRRLLSGARRARDTLW